MCGSIMRSRMRKDKRRDCSTRPARDSSLLRKCWIFHRKRKHFFTTPLSHNFPREVMRTSKEPAPQAPTNLLQPLVWCQILTSNGFQARTVWKAAPTCYPLKIRPLSRPRDMYRIHSPPDSESSESAASRWCVNIFSNLLVASALLWCRRRGAGIGAGRRYRHVRNG